MFWSKQEEIPKDKLIKEEIIRETSLYGKNLSFRIFTEEEENATLFQDGGLCFESKGRNYGSCKAVWYQSQQKKEKGTTVETDVPVIALEVTDALRKSSDESSPHQKFHHILGAAKNGAIGIYVVKSSRNRMTTDLYRMALQASQEEKGCILVVRGYTFLRELLELIAICGLESEQVKQHIQKHMDYMYKNFNLKLFASFDYSWEKFAKSRGIILNEDSVISFEGRMKINFIGEPQNISQIAVSNMYLLKYFFPGKKIYYVCPRMSSEDVKELDQENVTPVEWELLRNEEGIYLKTLDDLEGVSEEIKKNLLSIHDIPLTKGSLQKEIYANCIMRIRHGLIDGTITLK